MSLSMLGWQRRGWAVLGASAIAIALLIAACGGKSDAEPTTTSAGSGPGGSFGAFGNLDSDALSACMAAAGFEFDAGNPAGGLGGPGASGADADPGSTEALRSCVADQGVTFPGGAPPDGGFQGGGPGNFDIATVVRCLQDDGIDLGDAGDSADLQSLLQSLDRTDPNLESALQGCMRPGGPQQ